MFLFHCNQVERKYSNMILRNQKFKSQSWRYHYWISFDFALYDDDSWNEKRYCQTIDCADCVIEDFVHSSFRFRKYFFCKYLFRRESQFFVQISRHIQCQSETSSWWFKCFNFCTNFNTRIESRRRRMNLFLSNKWSKSNNAFVFRQKKHFKRFWNAITKFWWWIAHIKPINTKCHYWWFINKRNRILIFLSFFVSWLKRKWMIIVELWSN